MASCQEKPIITVITPNYRGKHLLNAVCSVLAQTYEKIQYIVIDDGSEGFDEKALREYIDTNKRSNLVEAIVEHLPQNCGTVRALNRAIRLAAGEIVFNLACDDVFADTNVIADWVSEFQRTEAGVLTAYRLICGEDMRQVVRRAPLAGQVRAIRTLPPEVLFERLIDRNFIFGSCTAYARSCIEQFGPYDERYRLIEDYAYIMKLLRKGQRIGFFDRVVVKCRGGGVSAAVNYNGYYERDTDLIFKYEIIPFAGKPNRAKRQREKWKRRHERERAFGSAVRYHGVLGRIVAVLRFPEAAGKNFLLETMRWKRILDDRIKK